jgi:hypothetical protein
VAEWRLDVTEVGKPTVAAGVERHAHSCTVELADAGTESRSHSSAAQFVQAMNASMEHMDRDMAAAQ